MKAMEVMQLQSWWIARLRELTDKVNQEEEKRQAKVRRGVERQLGEYKTFADVQDAYGCGVISEKKRDRLYDLLEKQNVDPDWFYEAKIQLLSELYQTARKIFSENMDAIQRHGDV
ncbi:MAG: hypothetical protein J6S83_05430 [Lachnospiraceae bacterium]|nr:hypothetical protein [Lachnospiraceae bacterium]